MIRVQFISVQTLKDKSPLQANVDEKILNIAIKEYQELELKKVLGRVEYERLQDAVVASLATPPTELSEADKILFDHIVPVMVYGALMYSISPIHNKLTNAGAKVDEYQNSRSADLAEARADYAFKVEGYKRDLIEHITEVSTTSVKPCISVEDTTFAFTGISLPDSSPDYGAAYDNRYYKVRGGGRVI